jgi:hypothetical protein
MDFHHLEIPRGGTQNIMVMHFITQQGPLIAGSRSTALQEYETKRV